jgi:glycine dehydrogenase subunit 1
VIDTYCGYRELNGALTVREVPIDPATGTVTSAALAAVLGDDVAAVYIETPNSWGVVEADIAQLVALTHEHGAEAVVGVDPISLGLLASPATVGADILVGSLQPLGVHLYAGGGVGGFIASRDEERYARQFPTLQVSIAPTRVEGQHAFGLTLFEQSSYGSRELGNDWTGNSVYLWTVRNAVFLALLGPAGMRELAETVVANARRTAELIGQLPGVSVRYRDSIFKEFIVDFTGTGKTVSQINAALLERGILGGHDLSGSHEGLDGCALYCVTEVISEGDVDQLISALTEVLS